MRQKTVSEFPIIPTERGLATDLTVNLRHGLHSRPSAKFAQIARTFSSDIWLITESGEADAKSMLEILGLAVQCHMPVRILANGPDAEAALKSLRELLAAQESWPAQ